MKHALEKLEGLLEKGGIKKDIILLVISGAAVICSLLKVQPLPFDMAWIAIVLCGVPIILEALIGLVTRFDIKADVLVSLALIASVCIGEDFAAGEVAVIMQLGALLEELTVARDTPDSQDTEKRHGGHCAGRTGAGGGSAAGTARRGDPGGWGDPFRADLRQPGGHDGRIPSCG